MALQNIECPKCDTIIISQIGLPKKASSYDDCLRKCVKCNLGYSNAKTNPTLIYKYYKDNIPELLRQDIDFALDNSISHINKVNKRIKFGFSTSEDALTWTFFNYFVLNNRLQDLLKILNIDSDDTSDYDVYLWGVNICSKTLNTELNQRLKAASILFKENLKGRTEPDVIINLKDKLVFIEVKYKSPNDIQTNIEKFKKYSINDYDIDSLAKNGLYELYRNWAFVSELSKGNKFELINLGFNKHFGGKNKAKLEEFEKLIETNNGKFVQLSWKQIFDKLSEHEYDQWFLDKLNSK
ncbi:hypothetical protein H8R23_14505 [Flavobacterium sp. F-380]|uniref:Uncharacterized protein n=1 Tax=Flavobacterium kayseriense TaxID=2764714 RepID=A0ABR7JAR0_9FLAO|nr:hypothetical protein [Flavobacterium kayseriense]MBC5842622.1 hypothetical protein [Flavobacterium kayseriense]MBC5849152.1 hypothetical protein [Flavobacterium kayseriense]